MGTIQSEIFLPFCTIKCVRLLWLCYFFFVRSIFIFMIILDHFRIVRARDRFFFRVYCDCAMCDCIFEICQSLAILCTCDFFPFQLNCLHTKSNVLWLCFQIRHTLLGIFTASEHSYWCTTWSFSHSMWQSESVRCVHMCAVHTTSVMFILILFFFLLSVVGSFIFPSMWFL